MPNHIVQEMVPIPQMPFHPIQSPGVTLQTGAVHYLAPEEKIIPLDKLDTLFKATGLITNLKVKSLKLIKKGIKLFAKVAFLAVVAFSVAAVGITITAVFCKKTGLCAFKFHKLEFDREHIEAVRSLVSDDRITTLTKFVMNAIDQYNEEK